MSEKTLKFGDVVIIKKEFHTSKKPIALNLVDIDNKDNNKDFKYFIGYKEDNIFRPLCIILPQISGDRKYFDDGGKSMYFKIEDDNIF